MLLFAAVIDRSGDFSWEKASQLLAGVLELAKDGFEETVVRLFAHAPRIDTNCAPLRRSRRFGLATSQASLRPRKTRCDFVKTGSGRRRSRPHSLSVPSRPQLKRREGLDEHPLNEV